MRLLALSTGNVVAILVILGAIIFATIFGLSFLRAERARQAGEPVPAGKAVSRRDFFRGSLLVSVSFFFAEFGAATLSFLWPNLKGGFGSVIAAGSLTDIKNQIQSGGGEPVYNGTGRFYLVPYAGTASGDIDYAAEGVMSDGIMPLYQRCVHLGCRVPFCGSSKWFECPCHGSKYSEAGEYKLGPAPRGMDRFKITVSGDNVSVDTSEVVLGPPRGTNTTNQNPQGPFCVAPG